MKELFSTRIILLCIALFLIGGGIELYSSKINFQYQTINTIDSNGNVKSENILTYPLKYRICNIAKTFFYSLSVAIFVAVFIVGKIDEIQKNKKEEELKQFQEAINTDIFDSIFRKLMPEEIFNIIKEEIIENKLLREEADWIYDFTIQSDGKIHLKQTIVYKLKNMSRSEVNNPVHSVIQETRKDETFLSAAYCKAGNNTIISYNKNNDPGENFGVQITQDGDKTHINFTVIIPEMESVDFTLIYENLYSMNRVEGSYFTIYPIIKAKLTVNFPEEYEFSLFDSFSSPLRLISKEKNRHMYSLQGGALPHQGFNYTLLEKAQQY